jgi:ubiquinone/menaquinone biosynthesis C-methylase UbiE
LTEHENDQVQRDSPERFDPSLRQGSIIAAEHESRYRWAATAAAGKRVLDVACGTGYGSAVLAGGGATEVIGVDIDPAAIQQARTGYSAGGRARFEQGDLRDLSFEDGSFDLIVCFETIEHMDRQDAALDELRRVLRDSGHLLLSSPNRDVFPPGNPHHVREYVPEELEEALSARFPWVELWRQQTWLASLVLDDENASGDGDADLDLSVSKKTQLEPGQELYTIAAAGPAPLKGLHGVGMVCEPLEIKEIVLNDIELRQRAGDMWLELQEVKHELSRCKEALAEQKRLLADVEASKSWRITKPLRAGKGIRKNSPGA